MREPMTITIPGTFASTLTTNGRNRTHWRQVARDSDELKARTGWALKGVHAPIFEAPWRQLILDWTVYHPKGQPRFDDDNVPPALKPARDIIAKYLGIDDRHMLTGSITQINWGTHRGESRIVVTISAAGEGASRPHGLKQRA